MFVWSTRAEAVIADPKDYYTNGDIVKGKLVVTNDKPLTVVTIKVKLKCEEIASVIVTRGNTTYEVLETEHHLRIEDLVFPTPALQDMESGCKGKNHYTLQNGVHEFPFEFCIPSSDLYPQTYKIEHKSGIYWSIKGVIEVPAKIVVRKKRTRSYFEMRPSAPSSNYEKQVGNNFHTTSKVITVYLPGFANWLELPASKFKNLIPGYSRFRKKANIGMTVAINDGGLQQGKHPVGAHMSLDCGCSETSALLLIKGFEFSLKQKFRVNVNNGSDHENHRKTYAIQAMKNVEWDLKGGIERLNVMLSKAIIPERLPPTRDYGKIQVHYKFVMVIFLASRERSDSEEKIRISIPVHLLSFVAGEDPVDDKNVVSEKSHLEMQPPPHYYENDEKFTDKFKIKSVAYGLGFKS